MKYAALSIHLQWDQTGPNQYMGEKNRKDELYIINENNIVIYRFPRNTGYIYMYKISENIQFPTTRYVVKKAFNGIDEVIAEYPEVFM